MAPGNACDGRPSPPASLVADRIVAIARGLAPDRLADAVDALVDSGIRTIEVTLDSPDALPAITALAQRDAGHSGIAVGAGTVRSLDAARTAVAAGASFLVAPHTDPEVVAWAAAEGIPILPGAFTPTEIVAAWDAGAAAVKVFPADLGGPAYIRAIRAPLGDVPLVPTGGVTDANATAYLEAGAMAVGAGGWLLGDGKPQLVAQRAQALVTAVAACTGASV